MVEVLPDGTRERRRYTSQAAAAGWAAGARARLAAATLTTVAFLLEEYDQHLAAKGNKERSIETTLARLRSFVGRDAMQAAALTPGWCRRRYQELCAAGQRPDTHRNTLAEVKTWGRWLVKRGTLASNPLEGIDGVGRRTRGKAQLRIDEARRWMERAHQHAATGEQGAVAAMLTIVLGLRASEVVGLTVRDLDDQGRVLWVSESKTDAGRRRVRVPPELRGYLAAAARGKLPLAPLLGQHWRDWPRLWVQQICREAGVPVVTAHGMRGLHATLAYEAGETGEAVARALGHASPAITQAAYAQPEAVEGARQRAAMDTLTPTMAPADRAPEGDSGT